MSDRIAVFPGTFDPFTYGHNDLVERALTLFDKVVVAIAAHPTKQPLFDLNTRVGWVQWALGAIPEVEIKTFSGLLVTFVQQQGSAVMVRGVRGGPDLAYELQLAKVNAHLAPEIETVFLSAREPYSIISSSLVKELAGLGADLSPFVASPVAEALRSRST